MDSLKLDPQSEQERRECETVEGMRRRLQRHAYDNALVKAVFDAAHYRGLSGEDTMTWLAFEALRRVEKLEELILEDAMAKPHPVMIFPPMSSPSQGTRSDNVEGK